MFKIGTDLGRPTRWSDLYTNKVSVVPEDVRIFTRELCERYATNGFGYEGKDYSNYPKTAQIEANATSDEGTFLSLLNDPVFVQLLNNHILSVADKLNICRNAAGMPLLVRGTYKFNDYHGMLDHDAIQHMQYEKDKPYADILSVDYPNNQFEFATQIEIKSTFSGDKPTKLHKADIILQHVLGTNKIVLFLPTDFVRNDSSYVYAGTCEVNANWQNIHIDANWNISPWECK
jgi:hypothetical protein